MTLDEAIKHCEDKSAGCSECANEHRQLAEWLKELKLLRHLCSSNVESQRGVGVNRSIRLGGKICYLGNADFGTGLFDCTGETEIFEGDYVQGIVGPPVPVFYYKGTFYVGQFRPLNFFVKDGFVAKDFKVVRDDRIKGEER